MCRIGASKWSSLTLWASGSCDIDSYLESVKYVKSPP